MNRCDKTMSKFPLIYSGLKRYSFMYIVQIKVTSSGPVDFGNVIFVWSFSR